ncbi:ROK family protein [Providencia rettgeri]|uniref:ROK family protein n=1 Tax=Providencia rettgeri TaxID=587 RepID=A0AAP2JVT2_PRORE|nr:MULTISPECIES: ROK family protein [Providencia]MBC8654205.1 ROK family protein [Providencia vermicola]APC10844.1 N-acetylglucosamine repressor [Providencia rettgeri]AVL74407.1 ROK family protein [Providencia rettgeri]EIU7555868.1 ROK family protein [Providencia rettgeri]EJD6043074.1 ROK family protein [Providencia rettgeri]
MIFKQTTGFLSHLPITQPITHDKERIFFAILNGQITTRREAVKLLKIRSTTVSEQVTQLLDSRLLTETISQHSGRGRPSMVLVVNPNRLVTLVFQVISLSLHVFAINLVSNVIAHEQLEASPECDNSALADKIRQLYDNIIQKIPKSAEVTGCVFSLGGVFDRQTYHWIHASRWPKMNNLNIKSIFPPEYRVVLSRTLDDELMLHVLERNKSTLLLHWGYGVGVAFSTADNYINIGGNAFGEIGHWNIPSQTKPCQCGQVGCLETVTALWSIGTDVLADKFKAHDDEENVAEILASSDLANNSTMQQAISHMAHAASNICRVFFPSRLIVSGPFVKNPQIWAAFCDSFQQQNRFFGQALPELSMSQISRNSRIYGAALPVLEQTLIELLAQ